MTFQDGSRGVYELQCLVMEEGEIRYVLRVLGSRYIEEFGGIRHSIQGNETSGDDTPGR